MKFIAINPKWSPLYLDQRKTIGDVWMVGTWALVPCTNRHGLCLPKQLFYKFDSGECNFNFFNTLIIFLDYKKIEGFFFSVLLGQKGRSWRIRLLRLRRVFSIQSLSCLMSLTMTMMLMLSPGSILSILIGRTMGGDLLYV